MLSGLITLSSDTGQRVEIRSDVLSGIQQASASTGIDFSYLMAQANRESSFDPAAQAKSSSAAGLYQFIEQTWFGVVKAHAAEYGRGDLAEQITRRSDGRYVADAAARKQILELRRDPAFAAAMAAEHASDNKAKLEDKLDRDATGADLYMAHFLGISGAIKFLRTEAADPDRTGASLFPKAAAANPSVFYTPEGKARTVGEIYARFENSINADMKTYAGLEEDEGAPFTQMAGTHMAANQPAPQLATQVISQSLANGVVPASYFGGIPGPGAGAIAAMQMAKGDTPSSTVGRVGSLLSPLMLVTLAALPVARDDEKGDKPKSLLDDSRSGGGHAGRSGLFNPGSFGGGADPMQLDLLRAAYTS